MNVLMVTRPLGKPWDEGGKNLAYGLARNIKNHKISILTKNNFFEKINKDITIEKIYSSSTGGKIGYLDKVRLFIRLLKKDNSNIYQFMYTPKLITSLFNRFILRLKNKKSIQVIPTSLDNKNFINLLIFGDKIVVLSEHTKKILIKKRFKNVIKINSGIDTNFFKPNNKDIYLLKKFNLKNKFVVLIPSELDPKRGTRIVLKSILNLSNLNEFKKLFFIFSYRKKDKDSMEKKFITSSLNKNNINNFMFLENFYDTKSLISISDIVLYPTLNMNEKQEIPMILLESLSMKKPIIITDISPLNEILKLKCGVKVKKGDFKEISKALLEIMRNKKLKRIMGDHGRKTVLKNFNIVSIAKEYEKLYKE